MKLLSAVLLLAAACDSPRPGVPPPACVPNETLAIAELSIETRSGEGTLRGVDLDGVESTGEESSLSCTGEADEGDPDGTLVDAELFRLVLAFSEAFERDPAEALVGGPIELHLERRGESVCGGGWVALGDGPRRPLDWNGQNYRAYDLGSLSMRFDFGEGSREVPLRRVAARLTFADGLVESVVLAGAVSAEELSMALTEISDVDGGLLETLIEGLADLSPGADGYCTEVSVSLVASL